MTDDLITWLRAQLDEDEQSMRTLLRRAQENALAVQDPKLLGRHIPGWHEWPDVEAICQMRLAEVDAKRRILRAWENTNEIAREPHSELVVATRYGLEIAIRALALPYAGWPGYREEWRP